MKPVFKRPKSLYDVPFHYCPGCHHGIAHRLIAEAIDALGIQERVVAVASIGCSVFLYDYFAVDVLEAPHGRAPAVGTGIKRARPESMVFTYQGDGDLAAIGLAETIHAANRGEQLAVFFINNTIYGMTGGQMAPTTLPGQKTTTTPSGRRVIGEGAPIKMAEMIAALKPPAFVARVAVNNPKSILQARKAVQKAFRIQVEGKGYAFVEFLSACPTNWKMTPCEANRHVSEALIPEFPLGVFKGDL
ncbi:MAG: thiamine pyrophosphate-dependent enzyme [Thermodesulfobacteriota bacterium]|nr:thiamine pyrophosphate-dependent enzyme [Thermodesulfobacteriota bacterium]